MLCEQSTYHQQIRVYQLNEWPNVLEFRHGSKFLYYGEFLKVKDRVLPGILFLLVFCQLLVIREVLQVQQPQHVLRQTHLKSFEVLAVVQVRSLRQTLRPPCAIPKLPTYMELQFELSPEARPRAFHDSPYQ